MRTSFTPDHLAEFVIDAFNPPRAGRTKLGYFSQELVFSNVVVSEEEQVHSGDSLSEADEL